MSGQPLPSGWRMVRFGDVVRNVDVSVRSPEECGLERFVGLDHIDPESLRIKRWGLLADGTSFTRKFTAGQVLFGKRRAYQRKVAVADFDGLCSSDILVFEPSGDDLLPELLPFLVQTDSFFEHALGTSAGSLSPRTKWRDLAAYEFPLPPKDEQRRIAEILWAAEEAQETSSAVSEASQSLESALLTAFLHEGFESDTAHNDSPYGPIPASWDCLPCRELFSEPPRNGLSPKTNAEGAGYPTLSLSAIRNGRVVPDGNIKYALASAEEVERFWLKKGDLLVVRGNGNLTLVGRCGLVDVVPQQCFYPDLLIRIVFDPAKLRPEFACLQWNLNVVHAELISRAKSTNGIWKINGQDLRQHPLVVPPLSEQDRILRLVAAQMVAKCQADHYADSIRRLRIRLREDSLSAS